MTTIPIKYILRTGFLILLMPLLIGCQNDASGDDKDPILLTEQQKEMIKEERDQMLSELEDQMKAADQKIDMINQMMLEKGTEAANELDTLYSQTLSEVRTFRNDLEVKVNEVEATTDENWEQFKTDIDPYLNKVETDLDTLSARLQRLMEPDMK